MPNNVAAHHEVRQQHLRFFPILSGYAGVLLPQEWKSLPVLWDVEWILQKTDQDGKFRAISTEMDRRESKPQELIGLISLKDNKATLN